MKNLSTFAKSAIIAISLAGMGTAAIAASQGNSDSNRYASKVTAMTQSKISLDQAIAIAKKNVTGDLVGAEFDYDKKSASGKYEIEFVSGDNEIEIKIDANTGKVLKNKQEKLDSDDKAEYSAMKQAKISLTDAMKKAKQTVNGHIVEAELDIENGKAVYEIEVIQGNQKQKLLIDANTGSVISNQTKASSTQTPKPTANPTTHAAG